MIRVLIALAAIFAFAYYARPKESAPSKFRRTGGAEVWRENAPKLETVNDVYL